MFHPARLTRDPKLDAASFINQTSNIPHQPPRNNKMDFAPYQDQSPETTRALSPPPSEPRRSFSPNIRSPITSPLAAPPSSSPWAPLPSNQAFGSGDEEGGREGRLNEFETSLPIRMDYAACLAYLLLPPAGGVLLLVLERKSDYVRCVLAFLSYIPEKIISGGIRDRGTRNNGKGMMLMGK